MDPDRGLRARERARRQAGVTLLELMAVVAIMAILASIATPMYMRYLYRSRATEAAVVLGEIHLREEGWRALPTKTYLDVSANATAWFPGGNPGDSQQSWTNDAAWEQLFGAAHPKGYRATYFSYVVVADVAGVLPSARGFDNDRGFSGNDNWYIARALGDLDGDTNDPNDAQRNIIFEFSSESRAIWESLDQGWE
jgi:prepilin-type N-terminal cleavage/methylation domain-containing protein